MTLLKFAVTLLSTMVVAVNLSSEPVNSLAFAQLDQSAQEIEFRSKVQDLKAMLNILIPIIGDASNAAYTANVESKKN